jgi:hypothetical protein
MTGMDQMSWIRAGSFWKNERVKEKYIMLSKCLNLILMQRLAIARLSGLL